MLVLKMNKEGHVEIQVEGHEPIRIKKLSKDRLGFDAPKEIRIVRSEVLERNQEKTVTA